MCMRFVNLNSTYILIPMCPLQVHSEPSAFFQSPYLATPGTSRVARGELRTGRQAAQGLKARTSCR